MKYDKIASNDVLQKTIKALKKKNFIFSMVKNKNEALEKIKGIIPKGASVMNGSSVTLAQIGFVDYLKAGKHGWNNLHENILAEKDQKKQAKLRRESLLADYYLGSVTAMTENGELLIASNTGSQLPHIVFSSPNLIFVISTKKIVPNLAQAMERLEKYVIPLEDERMKNQYGIGTTLNKIVIFKDENPMGNRKINFILVEEDLGY